MDGAQEDGWTEHRKIVARDKQTWINCSLLTVCVDFVFFFKERGRIREQILNDCFCFVKANLQWAQFVRFFAGERLRACVFELFRFLCRVRRSP